MRAFKRAGHSADDSSVSQHQTEADEPRRDSGVAPREIDAEQPAFEPGQRAFSQFALARAACLDASALASEPGGLGSALLLLRAAVSLLAEARGNSGAAVETPRAVTDEGDARSVDAYLESALQRLPAEARRDVEAVLDAKAGVVHIASLDEPRQRAVFASLNEVARGLGQPLETAWAGAKRKELGRVTLWALAVLVLTGAAWKVLVPTNLALHAAVSVSSLDRSIKGNPRGLVDGDKKSMAIHTKKGQGEWASIDLGALESINEVRVYNRRDCCQARAVPLRIEVSSNGSNYVTVGRRDKVFDDFTLTFPPVEARYVRVLNESNNILHLAEVEVY